jgi:hypothetical protein
MRAPVLRILLLLVILLSVSLMPTGCGGKSAGDAPPHVAAMQTGEALRLSWWTVHDEYLRLHDALPERREWLETRVAPVIDHARRAVILTRQSAETWARTQTQPVEWDRMRDDAFRLLGDAAALLAGIREDQP